MSVLNRKFLMLYKLGGARYGQGLQVIKLNFTHVLFINHKNFNKLNFTHMLFINHKKGYQIKLYPCAFIFFKKRLSNQILPI